MTKLLLILIFFPYLVFADSSASHITFDSNAKNLLGNNGALFSAAITRKDIGMIIVKGKVDRTTTMPFIEIGSKKRTSSVTTSSLSLTVCQRVSGKRKCTASQYGGIFLNRKGKTSILLSVLPVKYRGAGKGVRPMDLVVILQDDFAELRVRRPLPSKREVAQKCGTTPLPSTSKISRTDIASLASSNFLTTYFHADSKLYSLFGSSTPDIISIALQSVASIYQSQLGLELRVAGITIYVDSESDPFSGTSGDHLNFLEAYLSFVNSLTGISTDLFHLLTAQRGFISAVGVAYTASVCSEASFKAGFSDYSSGLGQFIVTIAHEIGHGLGASHDNNDTASIMSGNGASRSKNPYFSTFSKNEILPYIESVASICLLDSTAPPAPTLGVVSIKRPGENRKNVTITIKAIKRSSSRGSVRGKISVKKIPSVSGRIIELRSYPNYVLMKTTKTNSKGDYSFSVRAFGKYYVVDRMTLKGSILVSF